MEIDAVPILDAKAILGEGSIWNWRSKKLNWVDIKGDSVNTFDPLTGKNQSVDTKEYVSTVVHRVPDHGDGLIVALTRTVACVNEKTGATTELARSPEPEGNRLNDGKCDARGRLWVGSMNLKEKPGAGALYMLDTNLKFHKKLDGVTISNGIVWSRDNRLMYYIDTGKNTIDIFDFDIESGGISNRRVLVENKWGCYFDGMTIDENDIIYVACWAGSRVLVIDTKTGALSGTVHVPGALNVTSCAFGGDEFSDLYITSSAENADFSKLPHAGSLFKATIPGVKGLPAYEFAGSTTG